MIQAHRQQCQIVAAALLVASIGFLSGCTNSQGQTDTSQSNPANGPVTSDTRTASPKESAVSEGTKSDTASPAPGAGAGATEVTNTAPKESPGGPGGTMMNKPSKNPLGAFGDGEITLRVKNALIADTNVTARDINVDTKSQVVVLRGKQASQPAIAAAVNDAKQIKGVDQVINQLKVK